MERILAIIHVIIWTFASLNKECDDYDIFTWTKPIIPRNILSLKWHKRLYFGNNYLTVNSSNHICNLRYRYIKIYLICVMFLWYIYIIFTFIYQNFIYFLEIHHQHSLCTYYEFLSDTVCYWLPQWQHWCLRISSSGGAMDRKETHINFRLNYLHPTRKSIYEAPSRCDDPGLLVICDRNPPPIDSPHNKPVMQNFFICC